MFHLRLESLLGQTCCLICSPPDHPRPFHPLPHDPLDNHILLQVPLVPRSGHELPIGGEPRQTLRRLYLHDRLSDSRAVDGEDTSAVGDHPGRVVAVGGPEEACCGAGSDAGLEGFKEALGADFAEGFEIASDHGIRGGGCSGGREEERTPTLQ